MKNMALIPEGEAAHINNITRYLLGGRTSQLYILKQVQYKGCKKIMQKIIQEITLLKVITYGLQGFNQNPEDSMLISCLQV